MEAAMEGETWALPFTETSVGATHRIRSPLRAAVRVGSYPSGKPFREGGESEMKHVMFRLSIVAVFLPSGVNAAFGEAVGTALTYQGQLE
jgi:hypothetical protein